MTDLTHAWEELEVVQPEWFFDDELSRLRLEWAASMREPEVAADRGRGQRLAPEARPTPAGRVGDGGERAAWMSIPGDQHPDRA